MCIGGESFQHPPPAQIARGNTALALKSNNQRLVREEGCGHVVNPEAPTPVSTAALASRRRPTPARGRGIGGYQGPRSDRRRSGCRDGGTGHQRCGSLRGHPVACPSTTLEGKQAALACGIEAAVAQSQRCWLCLNKNHRACHLMHRHPKNIQAALVRGFHCKSLDCLL